MTTKNYSSFYLIIFSRLKKFEFKIKLVKKIKSTPNPIVNKERNFLNQP